MKNIALFMLLMGSFVSWGQKEKSNSLVDYKSKSLKEWITLYKKDATDKVAKRGIEKYHLITEEKFIALTNNFWSGTGEMEYVLYDKAKVATICALNDDPVNGFSYIKFSPTTSKKCSDIAYTPTNYTAANFDPANSSFIVALFEVIYIDMNFNDEVLLLTKGVDYIRVPAQNPTADKPYTYKESVVIVLRTVNSKGETTAYYDISHDPGL